MPKKQYDLGGNLGQLELNWNFSQTKFEAKLNGAVLGECTGKEARQGKEFLLPDASVLKIKLAMIFLSYEIQLFRNGQPLAGSAADPYEQIKQAKGVAYFIGGLSAVLGLVAELAPVEVLLNAGVGYAAAVEGGIFLVLGYFISKHKAWAAAAATGLLALDIIFYVQASLESGRGGSIVAGLFVKIFLTIYLFKGYKAIRKLGSQAIN